MRSLFCLDKEVIVTILLCCLVYCSLLSPRYQILGYSAGIVIPFFLSFVTLIVINFKFSKDMVCFSIFYIISSSFGLLFFDIEIRSLVLTFFSLGLLTISGTLLLVKSIDGDAVVNTLWMVLLICISGIVVELMFPEMFVSIRGFLFSHSVEDYQIELNLLSVRNELIMRGYRPFLIFLEVSTLARFIAVIMVVIAFMDNFPIKILGVFFVFVLLIRSPSLLVFAIVLPFYVLKYARNIFHYLVVLVMAIFSLVGSYYLFSPRINNFLEVGDGSFDERYRLPFIFLFSDIKHIFGLGLGGHKPMYNYTCEVMASTRPHLDCSAGLAANSSLFPNLLIFGFFGLVIFSTLCYLRWRSGGVFLVLVFFGVELFMTGYNAPMTLVLASFVVSSYIYHLKHENRVSLKL